MKIDLKRCQDCKYWKSEGHFYASMPSIKVNRQCLFESFLTLLDRCPIIEEASGRDVLIAFLGKE